MGANDLSQSSRWSLLNNADRTCDMWLNTLYGDDMAINSSYSAMYYKWKK